MVAQYIVENLREVKRIRRVYGKLESPIYPYIWYRKHDDSRDLDADVWETIVRTVLGEADGLVLWGGFKTTAPSGPLPWDETPLVGDDQGETDGQTAAGVKETQRGLNGNRHHKRFQLLPRSNH